MPRMSFVGLFVCGQGKSLASAPHPGFTSLGQFMLALPPRVFDRVSVVPYFENDTVRRNSNSFGFKV
jgi:hypothetical protein